MLVAVQGEDKKDETDAENQSGQISASVNVSDRHKSVAGAEFAGGKTD